MPSVSLLNIKISNEEKNIIKSHFKVACSIIAIIGIATLILGFFSSRPTIAAIGALMSSFSFGGIFSLFLYEEQARIKKLKEPILKIYEEIVQALENAESSYAPVREELKKRSSQTLDSSNSASLNFLSLERLIESLSERLKEVYPHLQSANENRILLAEELLKKDLTFHESASQHLLDHKMPDMPANTWIDSLRFLSQKVSQDLKKIKP